MTAEPMTGSPAGPVFTHDELTVILDVLTRNADTANSPVRAKITGYMTVRAAWIEDARRRNLKVPF